MSDMKRFLAFLIPLFALLSCGGKDEPKPVELKPISFRASIGEFATKTASLTFWPGEKIGVFSASPLNISNAELTAGEGGSLSSAQTLYWGENQTEPSSFTAYYPYSIAAGATQKYSFEVSASSDFMLASATAKPGEVVDFTFSHCLSRLTFSIDNRLVVGLKSIRMKGVRTRASVDIGSASVGADGEPVEVVLSLAEQPDGTFTADAVFPPQTVNPTLVVVATNGKEYEFTFSSDVVLPSGVRSVVPLEVDPKTVVVAFNPVILDWEESWTQIVAQNISEVKTVGLGEFKTLPSDDGGIYRLAGKISGVSNAVEGAFSFTDAVDTVSVGSLLSPSCVAGRQFVAAGLKDGDFVRVYGARKSVDGVASLPAAVYICHAPGLEVEASSGETLVWTGTCDLDDWKGELRLPSSSFASVADGSVLCIHLSAVFNDFWALSAYSGTMDLILANVTGTSSDPVIEIKVSDSVAASLKSSGLVVRGTAVIGAVGV